MRQGMLITCGAIIESNSQAGWSLAMPIETTVLEVVSLMSAFGLYCELEEGAMEIRLLPLTDRTPPTSNQLAAFYNGKHVTASARMLWWGVDHARV